jgi:hypothetical protein
VVDADLDGRKDLLIGEAEGTIRLYRNINTDDDPEFDGGVLLEVGEAGAKTAIDVGQRPTPIVIDWNNDGARDLLIGAKDGLLRLYINSGTDSSWDFRTVHIVQENGADLIVPTLRASPHLIDIDGDDKKDLLAGNTEGQVLFYSNIASDASPEFSGYSLVEADGIPIDLDGLARSRPFVCDWDDDGLNDLLVGGSDGLVHLYMGGGGVSGTGDEEPSVSSLLHLMPAYPNPFNPQTTISYYLPEGGRVVLDVYDVSGKRITRLDDGIKDRGMHKKVWNGRDANGREVSSGVYFFRLRYGATALNRKAILLR